MARRIRNIALIEDSMFTTGIKNHQSCIFKLLSVADKEHGSAVNHVLHYGDTVYLQHSATNSMVFVNMHEFSLAQKRCNKMSLGFGKVADLLYAEFRILPAYKTRTEGDPVRRGDHINLRCERYEELFMSHESRLMAEQEKYASEDRHDESQEVA